MTDFSSKSITQSDPLLEVAGQVWQDRSCPDFWPLLSEFDPINLTEMVDVALLDRTDTKYVMHARQLYEALSSLRADYWILDIDALRLNRYRTLYFDTADFALYLRHHAGGRNRYKVRSRTYVDTSQSFLEIKHKTDQDRTIKRRLQTPDLVTRFTPKTSDFMETYFPLDPDCLELKLWNSYDRITLVSKRHQERLTLDLNLEFGFDCQTVALPGLAVAEIKQLSVNRNSDFVRRMRAMHIRPMGFSKYCIGVALLYPNVKRNRFKPKLRVIHKIIRGEHDLQRTY